MGKKCLAFIIFLFLSCVHLLQEKVEYEEIPDKYIQALKHIGKAEYRPAEKILKAIIEADPLFFRAYQQLVNVYAGENNLDDLVAYLKTLNNAYSLWALGIVLDKKGEYAAAVISFKNSVELNRSFYPVYENLIDTYWKNSVDRKQGALELDEYFSTLDSTFPDNPAIQFGRGYLLTKQSNYKDAFPFFQKAVELYPEFGQAHRQLGIIYTMRGQLKPALEKFQKFLAVTEAEGYLQEQGTALNNVGLVYGLLSENDQAAACYERALAIAVETGDKKGMQAAYGNLGNLYKNISKAYAALENYEKGLAIAIELGDRSVEAIITNNMGIAYGFLSEHLKSLEYYTQALYIFREIGDIGQEGMALLNIGSVYTRLAQSQKAIDYYNQALIIAKKTGRQRDEGILLGNMAGVFASQADYVKALEYYEDALTIAVNSGFKMQECDILGKIGRVYLELSDYGKGKNYYKEALAKAREIRDRMTEADNIRNIGGIYYQLKEYQKALEQFNAALEIFREIGYRRGEAGNLTDLSLASFELSEYTSALDYAQQALILAREKGYKNTEGLALQIIGRINYQQGKNQQAVDFLEETLLIFRETENRQQEIESLSYLGDVYFDLNDYAHALSSYTKAIASIESIRSSIRFEQFKTGFFSSKVETFGKAIKLLYVMDSPAPDAGYAEQGFLLAEKSKARGLLDLLSESAADISRGVNPELREEERRIENRYSSLNTDLQYLFAAEVPDTERVSRVKQELEALDNQSEMLRLKIIQTNPEYGELKYPEPVTFSQVRDALPDSKTVLLNYKVTADAVFAWRVSKEGQSFLQLPVTQEDLGEMVYTLRNCITAKLGEQLFVQQATGLYNMLLKPLLSGDEEHLIIIPDDVLNYLPFETLLTQLSENGNSIPEYKDLPYLIKKYTIEYAPSASVACYKKARTQSPEKDLFALGDPVYSEEDIVTNTMLMRTAGSQGERALFGRLIHSGEEVKNIGKLFSKSSIYTREAALEEVLKTPGKLENYRYIHLATHGLLNEQNPSYSGMVLTQDEDPAEDGFLMMREVFNFKLNADLVVLSACNTGMGQDVKGEGIVGFTRAWMYAGTPAVIVSLWNVNDQSTRYLMEQLYSNIKQNPDYSLALQRAKLDLIENNFSDPYYWAGFVLSGNM